MTITHRINLGCALFFIYACYCYSLFSERGGGTAGWYYSYLVDGEDDTTEVGWGGDVGADSSSSSSPVRVLSSRLTRHIARSRQRRHAGEDDDGDGGGDGGEAHHQLEVLYLLHTAQRQAMRRAHRLLDDLGISSSGGGGGRAGLLDQYHASIKASRPPSTATLVRSTIASVLGEDGGDAALMNALFPVGTFDTDDANNEGAKKRSTNNNRAKRSSQQQHHRRGERDRQGNHNHHQHHGEGVFPRASIIRVEAADQVNFDAMAAHDEKYIPYLLSQVPSFWQLVGDYLRFMFILGPREMCRSMMMITTPLQRFFVGMGGGSAVDPLTPSSSPRLLPSMFAPTTTPVTTGSYHYSRNAVPRPLASLLEGDQRIEFVLRMLSSALRERFVDPLRPGEHWWGKDVAGGGGAGESRLIGRGGNSLLGYELSMRAVLQAIEERVDGRHRSLTNSNPHYGAVIAEVRRYLGLPSSPSDTRADAVVARKRGRNASSSSSIVHQWPLPFARAGKISSSLLLNERLLAIDVDDAPTASPPAPPSSPSSYFPFSGYYLSPLDLGEVMPWLNERGIPRSDVTVSVYTMGAAADVGTGERENKGQAHSVHRASLLLQPPTDEQEKGADADGSNGDAAVKEGKKGRSPKDVRRGFDLQTITTAAAAMAPSSGANGTVDDKTMLFSLLPNAAERQRDRLYTSIVNSYRTHRLLMDTAVNTRRASFYAQRARAHMTVLPPTRRNAAARVKGSGGGGVGHPPRAVADQHRRWVRAAAPTAFFITRAGLGEANPSVLYLERGPAATRQHGDLLMAAGRRSLSSRVVSALLAGGHQYGLDTPTAMSQTVGDDGPASASSAPSSLSPREREMLGAFIHSAVYYADGDAGSMVMPEDAADTMGRSVTLPFITLRRADPLLSRFPLSALHHNQGNGSSGTDLPSASASSSSSSSLLDVALQSYVAAEVHGGDALLQGVLVAVEASLHEFIANKKSSVALASGILHRRRHNSKGSSPRGGRHPPTSLSAAAPFLRDYAFSHFVLVEQSVQRPLITALWRTELIAAREAAAAAAREQRHAKEGGPRQGEALPEVNQRLSKLKAIAEHFGRSKSGDGPPPQNQQSQQHIPPLDGSLLRFLEDLERSFEYTFVASIVNTSSSLAAGPIAMSSTSSGRSDTLRQQQQQQFAVHSRRVKVSVESAMTDLLRSVMYSAMVLSDADARGLLREPAAVAGGEGGGGSGARNSADAAATIGSRVSNHQRGLLLATLRALGSLNRGNSDGGSPPLLLLGDVLPFAPRSSTGSGRPSSSSSEAQRINAVLRHYLLAVLPSNDMIALSMCGADGDDDDGGDEGNAGSGASTGMSSGLPPPIHEKGLFAGPHHDNHRHFNESSTSSNNYAYLREIIVSDALSTDRFVSTQPMLLSLSSSSSLPSSVAARDDGPRLRLVYDDGADLSTPTFTAEELTLCSSARHDVARRYDALLVGAGALGEVGGVGAAHPPRATFNLPPAAAVGDVPSLEASSLSFLDFAMAIAKSPLPTPFNTKKRGADGVGPCAVIDVQFAVPTAAAMNTDRMTDTFVALPPALALRMASNERLQQGQGSSSPPLDVRALFVAPTPTAPTASASSVVPTTATVPSPLAIAGLGLLLSTPSSSSLLSEGAEEVPSGSGLDISTPFVGISTVSGATTAVARRGGGVGDGALPPSCRPIVADVKRLLGGTHPSSSYPSAKGGSALLLFDVYGQSAVHPHLLAAAGSSSANASQSLSSSSSSYMDLLPLLHASLDCVVPWVFGGHHGVRDDDGGHSSSMPTPPSSPSASSPNILVSIPFAIPMVAEEGTAPADVADLTEGEVRRALYAKCMDHSLSGTYGDGEGSSSSTSINKGLGSLLAMLVSHGDLGVVAEESAHALSADWASGGEASVRADGHADDDFALLNQPLANHLNHLGDMGVGGDDPVEVQWRAERDWQAELRDQEERARQHGQTLAGANRFGHDGAFRKLGRGYGVGADAAAPTTAPKRKGKGGARRAEEVNYTDEEHGGAARRRLLSAMDDVSGRRGVVIDVAFVVPTSPSPLAAGSARSTTHFTRFVIPPASSPLASSPSSLCRQFADDQARFVGPYQRQSHQKEGQAKDSSSSSSPSLLLEGAMWLWIHHNGRTTSPRPPSGTPSSPMGRGRRGAASSAIPSSSPSPSSSAADDAFAFVVASGHVERLGVVKARRRMIRDAQMRVAEGYAAMRRATEVEEALLLGRIEGARAVAKNTVRSQMMAILLAGEDEAHRAATSAMGVLEGAVEAAHQASSSSSSSFPSPQRDAILSFTEGLLRACGLWADADGTSSSSSSSFSASSSLFSFAGIMGLFTFSSSSSSSLSSAASGVSPSVALFGCVGLMTAAALIKGISRNFGGRGRRGGGGDAGRQGVSSASASASSHHHHPTPSSATTAGMGGAATDGIVATSSDNAPSVMKRRGASSVVYQ